MAESGEIVTRVARVLADSLGVDEDDITPSATLQGDLGAESIDFLDIVFRLEREFGIKIPRGELFPDSIFADHADFVQGDRVTDQGMAELRSRMPYADLTGFDRDQRLSAVSDLFTAGLVVRYVEWKLGRAAQAAPDDRGNVLVGRNGPAARQELKPRGSRSSLDDSPGFSTGLDGMEEAP